MTTLTSARNPLLQDVRQAVRRGTLTEQGLCVAEGPHLLQEALRSGCKVETVLLAESAPEPPASTARTITLPDALFRGLSSTESSQGVIALVQPPRWDLDAIFQVTPLVLVLDAIQDPGNAGTMLRAAEAFHATGVLLLKGSVNPYNPKALRASAGSVFRMPWINLDEQPFLDLAAAKRIPLYAALPQASQKISECDFSGPAMLIVGSEGHGIRASIRAIASPVTIPTSGVESLNAGIAAAILLYEAHSQRME